MKIPELFGLRIAQWMIIIGCVLLLFSQIGRTISKLRPPPKVTLESHSKLPTLRQDFILGSATAVSNAVREGKPPKGWNIVCDGRGHYSPRTENGMIVDTQDHYIRTNYFEATVTAWRIKEIWDSPSPGPEPGTRYKWKTCDE